MQFNFNCEEALGCDSEGFAVLEGSYQTRILPGFTLFVNEIIDTMGNLSAKAQELNTVVTTAYKFFGSFHRLFFKAKGDKVLGFLKVGVKKLFLRDSLFNYHEVNPLCVLDFYVHESCQRQGIGKQIFDYMLMFEKKGAQDLAYDKPSDKSLNFLSKHFGLVNYVRQNNSFVIFNEFFDSPSSSNEVSKTYDYNTNRRLNYTNSPIPNEGNSGGGFNRLNNLRSNTEAVPSKSVNLSQSAPRLPTPGLSNTGQNLVYNNTFNRKIIDQNVYEHPTTGFQTYYLNGNDSNYYDNIYSRKKVGLINDYMSSIKQEEADYVHQQIDVKNKSIENSNTRLNQLTSKISNNVNMDRRLNEELYNKRSQYATVFDDKKIIEHNYYNQYNPYLKHSISEVDYINQNKNQRYTGGRQKIQEGLQHYSPFSSLGTVYTNILPTTSSAYGAYFNNPKELDVRNQSPNRIYY